MTRFTTSVKGKSFRDSVSTITSEGKRNWVYAQQPKGKLYNVRTVVGIVYLLLFFSLPFARLNDNPVFLFNILERKFILFGITFWPQDFFIFGIGMLAFIVFIVVFTVVFGRVFCGWACPQTVFMEIVFRRIEYWIEGDAARQRLLDKAPYTAEKIIKKSSKHIVFFLLSFIITSTFLTYIIGTEELFRIAREPLAQHIGGYISLLIFTGVFYGVYAWFREQVCLIVCPYGRLQGVMTDRSSILVAYDYVRGEPREKFKKSSPNVKGDCIDCNQCVKVCPMAIDIRNGTQLDCTNCTACMDACDFMMEKVGKPKGLIRYASENGIAAKERLRITPRIIAYSGVLLALIGVFVILLATRKDIDAKVFRTPGMLFQQQENNMISNLYNIRLINKTHKDLPLSFKLEDYEGVIKMIGKDVVVNKESKAESEFFILIPKNRIKERKTVVYVGVYVGDKKISSVKTSFLGPVALAE